MGRINIDNLTPQQRERLAALSREFVFSTPILSRHETWHHEHHIKVSPYGAEFLNYHRSIIGELEDYLSAHGGADLVPIPFWNPAVPIPPELNHPVIGRNSNPNKPLPSWATVAGGSTPDPIFGHTSLLQFRSTDELGLALDANDGYHSAVHEAVRGDMFDIHTSPKDPVFWPWHAFLDNVWLTWQMISLRAVARSIGVSGDVSVLRDFVGGPPPAGGLSVAQKSRELLS